MSKQSLKWNEKPIPIILLLLLFFPLGLFFMWKNQVFTKTVRVVVSILFTIGIIGSIGGEGKSISNVEESYGKTYYYLHDERDYIKIDEIGNFTLNEYIPNSNQTFVFTGKLGENGNLVPNEELKYKGRNNYEYSYFLNEFEFYVGTEPDDSNKKRYRLTLKSKGYQTVDFKTNRREWKTEERSYYSK